MPDSVPDPVPDPAQPPLEQWPEDEGSAPYSRPETPSILKLLLRATPRVALAVLLAVFYSAAQGGTRLAFLLSWIVVVGSMLMPGWRRYVETGNKHKPAPTEPLIVEKQPIVRERPVAEERRAVDKRPVVEEQPDPRDEWDLPDDLPGERG